MYAIQVLHWSSWQRAIIHLNCHRCKRNLCKDENANASNDLLVHLTLKHHCHLLPQGSCKKLYQNVFSFYICEEIRCGSIFEYAKFAWWRKTIAFQRHFSWCVISILYVHISLLLVTVKLIVFSFSSFLSLMLSLKEPYRETSMGVKLNIAYQM